MNKVITIKIKKHKSGEIQQKVREAMNLADWKKYIKGKKIFIKVNLISQQIVPGICTSPFVFEGVLQEIRQNIRNVIIYFGDAEFYGVRRVENAVRNWGMLKIGEKYNAQFINLSKAETFEAYIGPVIGKTKIPLILKEVDSIITMPVIKTHCLTTITGALKNQWGLLPTVRYKLHPVVHDAIPEINKFFKNIVFVVGDMTVSQEGPGPRFGTPKICDLLFVSNDRVAVDTAAAKYMGFKPEKIKTIMNAEKIGIGSRKYKQVGDRIGVNPFRPAKYEDFILFKIRDFAKSIPLLGPLFFNTIFYIIVTNIAKMSIAVWYHFTGRKYADEVFKKLWYSNDYKKILSPD